MRIQSANQGQNLVEDTKRQLFSFPVNTTEYPGFPCFMDMALPGHQATFAPAGASSNPFGLPVFTSAEPLSPDDESAWKALSATLMANQDPERREQIIKGITELKGFPIISDASELDQYLRDVVTKLRTNSVDPVSMAKWIRRSLTMLTYRLNIAFTDGLI